MPRGFLDARRHPPSRVARAVGSRGRSSSAIGIATTLAGKTRRARLREGLDAHARVVRGRRVRARRPRGRAVVAGQPDRARRADRGHRARAVGLLPRDRDPHVRAGARRGSSRAPRPCRSSTGSPTSSIRVRSRPICSPCASTSARTRRPALRVDRRRQQHGALVDRGRRDVRPRARARVPRRLRARSAARRGRARRADARSARARSR